MGSFNIYTVFIVTLVSTMVIKMYCLKIGAVTYWDNDADYTTIPTNSYAIINPNSGILKASSSVVTEYGNIINNVKKTVPSAKLFGYVPTGYGNRTKESYNTIKAQIKAYFGNYSKLDGIFFDEIGPNCGTVKADIPQFRSFAKAVKSNSLITYNPGYVGDNWCYINYTDSGEIIMDFEDTYSNYISSTTANDLNNAKIIARSRGILTWHVAYSASTTSNMQTMVNKAKGFGADYVYVTNLSGGNPYQNPPSYWTAEKQYVASV